MVQPIEFLFPPEIGTQLIYSFIIIVCSLMIYNATKEMYELSSYKGIKYFRKAFLFFAIAYFFRYFINFFLIFLDINDISPRIVFGFSLFIFIYSNVMAAFYLLHSVLWKKLDNSKTKIYLFNFVALVIAITATFFRSMLISILLNFALLAFASLILFVAYRNFKNKKKGKNLFVIYLLLFVFLVLNIIDILIPRFLQLYQLIIYLISISLFMTILYKVLKKTGA